MLPFLFHQAQVAPAPHFEEFPKHWEPPPQPLVDDQRWREWYVRMSVFIQRLKGKYPCGLAAERQWRSVGTTWSNQVLVEIRRGSATLQGVSDNLCQEYKLHGGQAAEQQPSCQPPQHTWATQPPKRSASAIRSSSKTVDHPISASPSSPSHPGNLPKKRRFDQRGVQGGKRGDNVGSGDTAQTGGQVMDPEAMFNEWKARFKKSVDEAYAGVKRRQMQNKLDYWLKPKEEYWKSLGELTSLDWSVIPFPPLSEMEKHGGDDIVPGKGGSGKASRSRSPRSRSLSETSEEGGKSGRKKSRPGDDEYSPVSLSSNGSPSRDDRPPLVMKRRAQHKEYAADFIPLPRAGAKVPWRANNIRGEASDGDDESAPMARITPKSKPKKTKHKGVYAHVWRGVIHAKEHGRPLTGEEGKRRHERARRFAEDQDAQHKDKSDAPNVLNLAPTWEQRDRYGKIAGEIIAQQGKDLKQGEHFKIMTQILKCKGSSQAVEKPYLRLTGAPEPQNVRPQSVLETALPHVLEKYKNDWHKLNDQLRAQRQDLKVQGIESPFAICLYETHARLCLKNGDLGQFNQCQTQLSQLYTKRNINQSNSHPAEFCCYLLLYLAHMEHDVPLVKMLASIPGEYYDDDGIKFARSMVSTLKYMKSDAGNFVKYFKLARNAPYDVPDLLAIFAPSRRLKALTFLTKSFKLIRIDVLTRLLNFQSDEECVQFVRSYDAKVESSCSGPRLDCKNSHEALKRAALRPPQVRAAMG
uniref:SAC3/GANP/THP3 conserved domain-containing protein n=1 Tax=Vitrella brassicaformis TaxID=1169539 RepID=A0A7S1JQG3_9ALVE|mmetsp:Transcript_18452/g.44423  ORF Transcript_18452/g.44423 Transcript_18452/m.44423 type:complete len:750 (+) Transcript_18452:81-2330(+)